MPGLDRSGPMGSGPMTGGRRGLCIGAEANNFPPRVSHFGNKRGRGTGCGFGARSRYQGRFGRESEGYIGTRTGSYPTNRSEDIETLNAHADYLKKSLDAVNRRIQSIHDETSER